MAPDCELPVFDDVVNVGHELLELLESVVNLERSFGIKLVDIFNVLARHGTAPIATPREHNNPIVFFRVKSQCN